MRLAAVRQAAGPPAPAAAPLETLTRVVPAGWIDYNNHVHESRYLQLAADATDALLARLGLDAEYLESSGSYYTVETHICHIGQLHAGDH